MMNTAVAVAHCRICRRPFPVTEYLNHKGPNGRTYRRSECKGCMFARNGQNRRKAAASFRKAKNGKACVICGWNADPDLLQYDHINPSEKRNAVANMCSSGAPFQATREAQKCRLLCPNCHAAETKKQRAAGVIGKARVERPSPVPVKQAPLFHEGLGND